MANVKVGDRIVMKDGAPYCYTVGGTTGTVTMVNSSTIKVDFDFPLDTNYTVNIADVCITNKESAMFDHDMARSGKIDAIRALRAFVPGLCLKEAKDIVESINFSFNGSDLSVENTNLRAKNDALTKSIDTLRAEYNDLLTYVPTDKLIDLLRK